MSTCHEQVVAILQTTRAPEANGRLSHGISVTGTLEVTNRPYTSWRAGCQIFMFASIAHYTIMKLTLTIGSSWKWSKADYPDVATDE